MVPEAAFRFSIYQLIIKSPRSAYKPHSVPRMGRFTPLQASSRPAPVVIIYLGVISRSPSMQPT